MGICYRGSEIILYSEGSVCVQAKNIPRTVMSYQAFPREAF